MTPEQISRNPDVDYTRYVVGTMSSFLPDAKGEWSKTRFNFPRILGCWASNTGGSVSVFGRHVCWLKITADFIEMDGLLGTTCLRAYPELIL